MLTLDEVVLLSVAIGFVVVIQDGWVKHIEAGLIFLKGDIVCHCNTTSVGVEEVTSAALHWTEIDSQLQVIIELVMLLGGDDLPLDMHSSLCASVM